jgi:hypothetical protein
LAFCGAAEMGCAYMMARYYNMFSNAGGDPKWIVMGTFPQKYR